MSFSYKPLWKLLIDKEMTKKTLMKKANFSKSTLDKMSRGENISLEILGQICEALSCKIEDIISYNHKKDY